MRSSTTHICSRKHQVVRAEAEELPAIAGTIWKPSRAEQNFAGRNSSLQRLRTPRKAAPPAKPKCVRIALALQVLSDAEFVGELTL